MVHTQSVDAITDGFPSPTLPNQPGKPSYCSIRDTHRLLTVNAASIKSPCGEGQNGHLRIVLTTTQYALVSRTHSSARPTLVAHPTSRREQPPSTRRLSSRSTPNSVDNTKNVITSTLTSKIISSRHLRTYTSTPSRTRSPATPEPPH